MHQTSVTEPQQEPAGGDLAEAPSNEPKPFKEGDIGGDGNSATQPSTPPLDTGPNG